MSSPTLKDRCDSFKSIHVDKSSNLKEEIEKLPPELKDLWRKRQFAKFLKNVENDLAAKENEGERRHAKDLSEIILPFLLELGCSFDNNVHKLIISCYLKVTADSAEQRLSIARSCNRYVDSVLSRERLELVPDVAEILAFSVQELIPLSEEQTFKVEEEMRLEFQKQIGSHISRVSKCKYALQEIALKFMDKLYIYPLDSTFPELPGVYFIYHVGKIQLYEESQVFPSARYPVYVGMSKDNIARRLRDHHKKIEDTKKRTLRRQQNETEGVKLELTDFVVRFMIVDVAHYAPCIEGMLIEYFNPVWNSEAMKFSFGSGDRLGNLWYEFHNRRDPKTIENVLSYLKI